MDEYINRGTAIAKLTALEVTEPNATMADAKRVLADMQTADVASVVRCKDCSWYQSVDDDGDDFEVCNYYNREVMGSQFCSEAEPYKTPEEKAEFRRSVGLSACGFVITTDGSWDKPTKKYCEDCGAKIDEKGDVYD